MRVDTGLVRVVQSLRTILTTRKSNSKRGLKLRRRARRRQANNTNNNLNTRNRISPGTPQLLRSPGLRSTRTPHRLRPTRTALPGLRTLTVALNLRR